ncbi:hypothetical protein B2M26_00840 [Ferroacidibacillus organovorans]|uniref:TMEM205-like domain-containing protein n=1 Tax=Ferroacidibacillus organovorans TaxID=1765683 RepID=A0A1V4EXG1_9BACL|nr:hypothetical protein B2M26_00840 [Ferroacidibacillus organovorans]
MTDSSIKGDYSVQSTSRSIYSLATALSLGAMVFFSLIVAETIFASLTLQSAGTVLAHLFPSFYRFTGISSLIASVCTGFIPWPSHRYISRRIFISSAWLSTLFLAFSDMVLLPAMNAARLRIPNFAGPMTPVLKQFFFYHGISMGLIVFTMILTLLGLLLFTIRGIETRFL